MARQLIEFFDILLSKLNKSINIGDYQLNWRNNTLELTREDTTLTIEPEKMNDILNKIFNDEI
jgi:hypothetical protein